MVIRDWLMLAEIIADEKLRGNKVVTTNGVFDVLHVGHLSYLQQSRALGDMLVVGINSDSSTRSLKGETRPIVPQDERAELLDALNCVDYVTFFDEGTPCKFLEVFKPNFHTKGGDYNPDDMPETVIVKGYGGEVVVLPFVEGHSTSDIITKILNSDRSQSPQT